MAGGYHVAQEAEQQPLKNPVLAWVVVLFAALFFFYEYIQGNMFNSISQQLLDAFHINATQLGQLSSYYFIANVVFLFVAGSLLDRFSTKKIILASLLICVLGTLTFAMSTTLFAATVSRFLTGIGSAFCFLSCIRLASRWFPASKMGMVTGFIVTLAMLGGMVAQTPLAHLVHIISWREALYYDAGLGILVWLIILAVVRDCPLHAQNKEHQGRGHLKRIGYWRSFFLAFGRLQNWLGGIYTCLMNLPLMLLGSLWGALYLKTAYHMGAIQAADISSMLFLGTIVGSPIVGWVSDRISLRKPPMIVGTCLSLLVVLVIIYSQGLSYVSLIILFFLVGLFTSSQILGYPVVAESSPRMITAMSVCVVNITAQGGIAIFQPLYGFLMDLHVKHSHGIAHVYHLADFSWSMLIFPFAIIIALFAALALRETHGCSMEQNLEKELDSL